MDLPNPIPAAFAPFFQEAACTRCKGSGKRVSPGFTAGDGTVYEEKTHDCYACKGRGSFPAVNVETIKALIATKRKSKDGKQKFRASWPGNVWREADVDVRRAYYVWRLTRFHGGADVTMPMTAMSVVEGDPHVKLLDVLSDYVAKQVFGTDRAASHRWGRALGFVAADQPGLPESAYEGGPVVTSGEKPAFEQAELDH